MKKYEVKIYFTSFCGYIVEAKEEEEAIEKARKLLIDKNDLLSNIKNWKEADEAFEIKNNNQE